jgi:hypothetical protein
MLNSLVSLVISLFNMMLLNDIPIILKLVQIIVNICLTMSKMTILEENLVDCKRLITKYIIFSIF